MTGLLTGSVVGGIAALLFAPKSGKEFRKDISAKSSELYDDASHLMVNAKDKTSEMLSEVSKKQEVFMMMARKKLDLL
ncbi:MAG: YtxH domain-containing protein [Ignavibacteria bacterium]|nr:YtxH domain-containing protein [Ignavibacteria bacterium]